MERGEGRLGGVGKVTAGVATHGGGAGSGAGKGRYGAASAATASIGEAVRGGGMRRVMEGDGPEAPFVGGGGAARSSAEPEAAGTAGWVPCTAIAGPWKERAAGCARAGLEKVFIGPARAAPARGRARGGGGGVQKRARLGSGGADGSARFRAFMRARRGMVPSEKRPRDASWRRRTERCWPP